MYSYELMDYSGNKIIVDKDKAEKIAGVAGLIAIEVGGQTHYVNAKHIASIKPTYSPENKIKIGTETSNQRVATDEGIARARANYNKLKV